MIDALVRYWLIVYDALFFRRFFAFALSFMEMNFLQTFKIAFY